MDRTRRSDFTGRLQRVQAGDRGIEAPERDRVVRLVGAGGTAGFLLGTSQVLQPRC